MADMVSLSEAMGQEEVSRSCSLTLHTLMFAICSVSHTASWRVRAPVPILPIFLLHSSQRTACALLCCGDEQQNYDLAYVSGSELISRVCVREEDELCRGLQPAA